MTEEEKKQQRKEYQFNNKDRIKAQRQKYRIEHKKEISEYNKKYIKDYYQKNKKKFTGESKTYRLNPVVAKKHVISTKNWKSKHKEQVSEYNRKRSILIKLSNGNHTQEEFEEMKKRYNYTCLSCGEQEPKIKLVRDHIIPIIQGGSNSIKNIQPLCNKCNCKKYTNTTNYIYQKQKG